MKHAPGRFVAVNLTETEYQALRRITTDPATWLRQQVDALLATEGLSHAQVLRDDEPIVAAWSYTIRH